MGRNKALGFIIKTARCEFLKIFAVTVVNACIAALGVYFALTVRNVINCAVSGDVAGARGAAVVMAAVVALEIILYIICRMLEANISSRLEIAFRERVFRALLVKDYSAVSTAERSSTVCLATFR